MGLFNLFKSSRKRLDKLQISNEIIKIYGNRQHVSSIELWIKDQILFQFQPAKYYRNLGIDSDNEDDLVIVHFFNKEKTHTVDYHDFFAENYIKRGYIHQEDPRDNHQYIRFVGHDPIAIEENLESDVELYSGIEFSQIFVRIYL